MAAKIKYKILKAYPEVRGVDVHYYTDEYPEGRVLHVQFMGEKVPETAEEIDAYILSYAPREDLAHKARLVNEPKAEMKNVLGMVGQEREERESIDPRLQINTIVL